MQLAMPIGGPEIQLGLAYNLYSCLYNNLQNVTFQDENDKISSILKKIDGTQYFYCVPIIYQ